MDIHGERVIFTPREAQWTQETCIKFDAMADFTQRIFDARLAVAEQWLEPGQATTIDVRLARRDFSTGILLGIRSQAIHDATVAHCAGEVVEDEPHVIPVHMNTREKVGLLVLAHREHIAAQEGLEASALVELENATMRDDLMTHEATSDFMDPEEVLEVWDMVRDPEVLAAYAQSEDLRVRRIVAVTGSILAALRTELRPE